MKKETSVLNCAQLSKKVRELEETAGGITTYNPSSKVSFKGEEPKKVGNVYEILSDNTKDVPTAGYALFKTKHTVTIPEGFIGIIQTPKKLKDDGQISVSNTLLPGETDVMVSIHNLAVTFKRVSKGAKIGELVILKAY